MTNNALRLKSLNLANLIADYDDSQLRAIAVRAATLAIDHTQVQDRIIGQALTAVQAGDYGDAALQLALERLADDIEAPYLAALGRDEDISAQPQLIDLFCKARAVTALRMTLSDDIRAQAGNALYEALYAGVQAEAIAA